jgi:hypothetical protein
MYSSFWIFGKPLRSRPTQVSLSDAEPRDAGFTCWRHQERRGFIVVSAWELKIDCKINAALDRLDEQTKVAYICNTATLISS